MLKKAGVTVRGKKAVILGSGGASRAVIYALYTEGASDITVAARNEAAKAQLKQQFPYIHTCTLDDPLSGDILVNTTPVGKMCIRDRNTAVSRTKHSLIR